MTKSVEFESEPSKRLNVVKSDQSRVGDVSVQISTITPQIMTQNTLCLHAPLHQHIEVFSNLTPLSEGDHHLSEPSKSFTNHC